MAGHFLLFYQFVPDYRARRGEFRDESAAVAECFAAQDPCVRAGLVLRWTVRRWVTVIGEAATTPVRPARP